MWAVSRARPAPACGTGTFNGVVEKIPYLRSLGVTAVELLPVCEFDDSDVSLHPSGETIRNYWGYSTVGFFSPHAGYAVDQTGMFEFSDIVKALHAAGIEVILDVVFNHTDEGNEFGPTQSFRGIDNRTYYVLDPNNSASYASFTGVGTTFNAN